MIPSPPTASDVWLCAGWTMLHYAWLGTLVAVLAFVSKCVLRRAPSDARYVVALCWLAALAGAPVGIAVWVSVHYVEEGPVAVLDHRRVGSASVALPEYAPLEGTQQWPATGPDFVTGEDDSPHVSAVSTEAVPSDEVPPSGTDSAWRAVVGFLPWIWIVGAPLTFAWSVAGLAGAERLRRLSTPANDQVLSRLCRRLAESLGISRMVAVHVCQRIGSPILVGIVRPAVLLPPALVAGLSPDQLEMVLLHELAHVRRWDNLVNLLQRIIESLLFFHPAVWLVSRWVRVEREHCCDDVVMGRLGNQDAYAEALLAVADKGPGRRDAEWAVSAGTRAAVTSAAGSHLGLRIRRILTWERETMQVSRKLAVVIFVALLATFLCVGSLGLSRGRAQPSSPSSESAGQQRPAGLEEQRPAALRELIDKGHKEDITNSIDMKLRLIPPGSFMMGQSGSQHKVTITKPFYVGVCEVTQEQYKGVMGENPNHFIGPNRPAGNVSWNDAKEFCRRLSQRENTTYRLPTEAEWEYACRAGTTTKYYWGDEYDERYCWNGPKLRWHVKDVGGRLPNAWGLYDMSGNVWEWCEDWYVWRPSGEQMVLEGAETWGEAIDSQDPSTSGRQTDPRGPSRGEYRVARGGSCRDNPKWWWSAAREAIRPDYKYYAIGFRVVKQLPGPHTAVPEKNHAGTGSGPTVEAASPLERTGNLFVRVLGKGIQAHWGSLAYPAGEWPDGKNRIESSSVELNHYAFKGLKAGEYVVRAPIPFEITGANGKATVQLSGWARATVKPGKDTRVEIEFQENAEIRGAFQCPDKNMSWRIILLDGPNKSCGSSSSEISQARALGWKMERTGSYEIRYLSPGTYTIIGRICKPDENWTPVMEKKKTVTVGEGGVAVVDFDFASEPPDARVSTPSSSPEEEEGNKYQKDLQALFNEIDKTYPFFDLKNIREDWVRTKERLAIRVRKCESDTEFMRIVLDAMKCLRDSHIQIHNIAVKIPWPAPEHYPCIGFMPAQSNTVVIVLSPPGQERALPVGTVVKTIDGVDARQYLDARAKEAWQSGGFPSPQRARLFAYRIPLKGAKGTKHKLVVQRQDGEEEIVLECSTEARGWPHTYNLPRDLARVGRSFFYAKLPSGVGYMYLRRVDSSVTEGIRQAMQSHPDVSGWIVDLRGNGGGGYDSQLIERIKQLPRPVAGLIDAGCMSAGETLARDLRRHAAARLFGSKTAGSSSAKKSWQFPSGIASLTIPVRSRWRADQKPIEYNGIEPDEHIEPASGDLLKGLNTGILRAEEYIRSQSSKPNNSPKGSAPSGREKAGASITGRIVDVRSNSKPLEPLPSAKDLPGTVLFHGRYKHRSRKRDLEEPGELWLKQTQHGGITAWANVPFMGSTEIVSGDKNNRLTSYRIGGSPSGDRSGYRIDLELCDGKVLLTRRGLHQDCDGKELTVPEGALFDPNSRPDSYCAANVLLRGFALEEGESREFRTYDWDNSHEALVDYSIRVEHAGKQRVDVPAGTFEANHFVLTQMTSADSWLTKRAGDVTEFWVLDNDVIVRVLRHRGPYQIELLEYTVPDKLPGQL